MLTVMDYERIVKAVWANDPQFVTLCKSLWGPATTAEDVVAFGKNGPDPADLNVLGAGKRKKLPTVNKPIAIAKAAGNLAHIPKAERSYQRDDKGRFASVGEIAYNSTVAATTGVAGGLAGSKAVGDAKKLGKLISELKATPEGRQRLISVLGSRGSRLGLLAAGGTVLGAAAGYHGKEAYEGIKDMNELERAHSNHVKRIVRQDDINAFNTDDGYHDLEIMTRGARRDARTVAWTKGADAGTLYSTDSVKAQKDAQAFARMPHEDRIARLNQERENYATDAGSYYYQRQREQEQADFGKAAEEVHGTLTSVDADKRQVFGWASIVEKNGNPVIDLQGDYIGIDELEKSAYEYVQKSRIGGAMHRRVDEHGNVISKKDAPYHAADLIESFVVTPEKIEKMGLPESTPVGWWVGFKVNDDDVWSSVKSGEWKGFSIHGAGRRKTIGEVDQFDITGAEFTR